MMRGVLHDVMHSRANTVFKGQMYGRGDIRLCRSPLGFIVIPLDALVGVVHIDHHANHAVPENKRYDECREYR